MTEQAARRILWHSVAPWVGSGYGQQTGLFVPRLRDLGHDVAVSTVAGVLGSRVQWNGVTVYPSGNSWRSSNALLAAHAADHFGDAAEVLVISLLDVWTMAADAGLRALPLYAWTPIDHDPVPPRIAQWFQESGATPVAMSRFGEAALAKCGLDPVYVPHGIDTSVFCPGDKDQARAALGLPQDAFVIAMVATNITRNPSRKGLPEQITAFAALRRRHSDAVLYLHTEPNSADGHGIDIPALLRCLDVPDRAVRWTDPYRYSTGLPPAEMAGIYRAADLFSNTSYGEGFGIGIIEAQACGVPVVVTDVTAMPELCGAGWTVRCQRWWHEGGQAFFAVPSIDAITSAYLAAYDSDTTGLSDQARQFALEYDANRITARYWKPLLENPIRHGAK